MRSRAEGLAERIAAIPDLKVSVVAAGSEPGSGSAPGVEIPTFVLRITHARRNPSTLASRLRAGEPPVFARVQGDALLLDPRTLLPGDKDDLVRAVAAAAGF